MPPHLYGARNSRSETTLHTCKRPPVEANDRTPPRQEVPSRGRLTKLKPKPRPRPGRQAPQPALQARTASGRPGPAGAGGNAPSLSPAPRGARCRGRWGRSVNYRRPHRTTCPRHRAIAPPAKPGAARCRPARRRRRRRAGSAPPPFPAFPAPARLASAPLGSAGLRGWHHGRLQQVPHRAPLRHRRGHRRRLRPPLPAQQAAGGSPARVSAAAAGGGGRRGRGRGPGLGCAGREGRRGRAAVRGLGGRGGRELWKPSSALGPTEGPPASRLLRGAAAHSLLPGRGLRPLPPPAFPQVQSVPLL